MEFPQKTKNGTALWPSNSTAGIIYLFLDRGEGREQGTETSTCGCLSHAPYWRPGPQPRHVTWLGIKPVTFRFTGWHSVHWARAPSLYFCLRPWRDNNDFPIGLVHLSSLPSSHPQGPEVIWTSSPVYIHFGGLGVGIEFTIPHHPQSPRYTKVLKYQAVCLGIPRSAGLSPIVLMFANQ